MSDLTEFLLARIAEDEHVARMADGDGWSYEPGHGQDDGAVVRTDAEDDADEKFVAMTSYDMLSYTSYKSDEDGEHIARHDPARVLAECEAKRRIVTDLEDAEERARFYADDEPMFRNRSEGEFEALTRAAQHLAMIWSSHPDFRKGWRP